MSEKTTTKLEFNCWYWAVEPVLAVELKPKGYDWVKAGLDISYFFAYSETNFGGFSIGVRITFGEFFRPAD